MANHCKYSLIRLNRSKPCGWSTCSVVGRQGDWQPVDGRRRDTRGCGYSVWSVLPEYSFQYLSNRFDTLSPSRLMVYRDRRYASTGFISPAAHTSGAGETMTPAECKPSALCLDAVVTLRWFSPPTGSRNSASYPKGSQGRRTSKLGSESGSSGRQLPGANV